MLSTLSDQLCVYAMVVKNGDLETIAHTLNVVELEHLSWEDTNEIRYYKSNLDRGKRTFDYFFISHPIMGWNYIFFEEFIGLNEILNHCNKLSKKYDEIFAFTNDAHCGAFMFLKIKNKSIVRLFQDIENERCEFGDSLEEENNLERTTGLLAIEVVAKVLKLEEVIKNVDIFRRKVGVGKKYKLTPKQDMAQLFLEFDKNDVKIDLNFKHDLPF